MTDGDSHLAQLKSLFAYDSNETAKLSAKVSQLIVEIKNATSSPEIPLDPEEVSSLFGSTRLKEEGEALASYMLHLDDAILPNVLNLSSPRNMAHMAALVPPFLAELAKLVAAVNANMLKTDASGCLGHCERQALGILHREVFEQSEDFYRSHTHNVESVLGIATSGGSTANLIGLWLARNRFLKERSREELGQAVIIASELSHYSVAKAVDILGLHPDRLISIPVDSNMAMDLTKLDNALREIEARKQTVLALVGIAGTTDAGSFDNLEVLGQTAKRLQCHFHVDACWGGPVFFSRQYRDIIAGIGSADTVALDAHKKFHLPIGLGILLCSDPTAANAIEHTATYLNRQGSRDLGRRALEGSRPAATLLLHACLHVLGRQGFATLVDARVSLARKLAELISKSEDFELMAPVTSDIILYRYRFGDDNSLNDKLNEALYREQRLRCRHQITMTRLPPKGAGGAVVLRAVITNPFSDVENAKDLIAEQRAQAQSILGRRANRRVQRRADTPNLRSDISGEDLTISDASVADVSRAGAFVKTHRKFKAGEKISIVLKREGGEDISLNGRIARRVLEPSDNSENRDAGIGLEFLDIDSGQRELLRQLHEPDTFVDLSSVESVGLAEAFEKAAKSHPDKVFFVTPTTSHTFGQAHRLYDAYVRGLRHLGAAGRSVVVLHDRTLDALTLVLALRRVGATYIPVDPKVPAARVDGLMEHAKPDFIVTDDESLIPELRTHTIEEIRNCTGPGHASGDDTPAGRLEEVPAAIMFTSGSTGIPKRIVWTEGRIWQRILAEPLSIQPDDCWCWFASCSFIDSVLEIFYPATQGLSVAAVPMNLVADPPRLISFMGRAGVTRFVCSASYLSFILSQTRDLQLHTRKLRAWVSTGEVLDWSIARKFQEVLPGSCLYNEYGSTELGDITFGPVPTSLESRGPVPAGQPLKGFEARIVNGKGEECPPGAPGHLQVRQVSGQTGDSDEWISTGDRASQSINGAITVVGRTDGVIKLRGIRMDPSEIEGILAQHPQVEDAAVRLWRLGEGSEGTLVAYLVTATGAQAAPVSELRALCALHLPTAMRPLIFEFIEEIPRTQSGKKLRRSLPAPSTTAELPAAAEALEASIRSRTELLRTIVSDALRTPVTDDQLELFHYGLESLRAIEITLGLERQFEIEIPPVEILANPTIQGLRKLIDGILAGRGHPETSKSENEVSSSGGFYSSLVAREQHRSYPLSCEQMHWVARGVTEPPEAIVAPLQIRGNLNCLWLEEAINLVIQRHESLRMQLVTKQVEEPYQVVEPIQRFVLRLDRASISADTLQEDLARIARDERSKLPPRLFNVFLLQIAQDDHVLMTLFDHSTFDDASVRQFFQEMALAYNAQAQGEEVELGPCTQYGDYALAQKKATRSDFWQKGLASWAARLDEPIARFDPGPEQKGTEPIAYAMHEHQLSPARAKALQEISTMAGCTPAAALLTAYAYLQRHYAGGQETFVISLLNHGRNNAKLVSMMGNVVKILPARFDLDPRQGFAAEAGRVLAEILAVQRLADVVPNQLIGLPDWKSGMDFDSSIWSSLFNYIPGTVERDEFELDGLKTAWLDDEVVRPSRDFCHQFRRFPGDRLAMRYNSASLSASDAEEMFATYLRILDSGLGAPNTPMSHF